MAISHTQSEANTFTVATECKMNQTRKEGAAHDVDMSAVISL